jgi:hypothetical protein
MSLWISSPTVLEHIRRVLRVEPTAWDRAGMLCPSVGLACGRVIGRAIPDVFSRGLGTVGVDPRQ